MTEKRKKPVYVSKSSTKFSEHLVFLGGPVPKQGESGILLDRGEMQETPCIYRELGGDTAWSWEHSRASNSTVSLQGP